MGRGRIGLAVAVVVALTGAAPAHAAYSSTTAGADFATMTGDGAGDTMVIDVSGGNLRHDRVAAGDPGFASDLDWNTSAAGSQTRPAASTNITINAGGGNDTVQAGSAAAPATTGPAGLNLNGGDGSDTFTWENSSDATGRAINFQGAPFNQVFVPSTGLSVTWGAGPFEQIVVNAGSGADTIGVTGSTAGTTSTINAADGADSVVAGPGTTLLDDLLGPLTVQGGAGNDNFQVDEDEAAAGHTYALDAATLQRDGAAQLGFGGFEALQLALGTGNDVLTATSAAQGFSVTGGPGADALTGGGGTDVLDGGDGDDTLNSRDAAVDADLCGAGTDSVVADDFDAILPDCETRDRGLQGPAAPAAPAAAVPAAGALPAIAGPAVLTSLAVSPRAFSPARAGGGIAQRRGGATVRYDLSAAGTVRFTVEQLAPGRRAGRRCVRPNRRNRRARRCTRVIRRRGSFTHAAAQGRNSFRFSGHIGGAVLGRGSYRLVATPLGADGTAGGPVRAAFRIRR